MREVERSAGSVEEALEAALGELGVSEQEAEVEVVQEPSKGLLGIRSQQAVVRVRARGEPAEPLDEESLEQQADVAADFVEGLLDVMDVPGDIEWDIEDETAYVDVVGDQDDEDLGLLIGKQGRTLDALQDLVRTAVQRKTGERCRVMVDVADYRRRRQRRLAEKARDAAQTVKKSGKERKLEPMNPYERKIVHDAVAEVGGLETMSVGEEPQRRVVIRKERR